MVQIIDTPEKKSFGASFSEGLSKHLPDALGNLIERKRREKELSEEDKALEEQGIHVKGIKNPKIRESLLEQHQKGQKREFDELENSKHSETIQKYFGKDASAIYDALTEGGKTSFFQSLFANTLDRDMPTNEFLAKFMMENQQDFKQPEAQDENPKNGEQQLPGMGQPKPVERDVDYGLNRKELTNRQEKRYEKNLPLYEAEDAKRHGLQAESETLDILQELDATDKLPKGFGRLNVNYKEGNLLIPALASPEAQRYVKTVNQFLNKAKDTFGSRVTNFELDRFLQQLPTLANTREGRAEIIKQMKYFNKIETTYHDELQKYVDEKGGIRNVDWDVAKRKAEERSKPLIAEAKKEFKDAEKNAKSLYDNKVTNLRSRLQKGEILVEKDGRFAAIPIKNFKEAKKQGYRRI